MTPPHRIIGIWVFTGSFRIRVTMDKYIPFAISSIGILLNFHPSISDLAKTVQKLLIILDPDDNFAKSLISPISSSALSAISVINVPVPAEHLSFI